MMPVRPTRIRPAATIGGTTLFMVHLPSRESVLYAAEESGYGDRASYADEQRDHSPNHERLVLHGWWIPKPMRRLYRVTSRHGAAVVVGRVPPGT